MQRVKYNAIFGNTLSYLFISTKLLAKELTSKNFLFAIFKLFKHLGTFTMYLLYGLLGTASSGAVDKSMYRSTSLCQTCLSRRHSICRSDHPFWSISPILLCISNLFMSNLFITKSQLYLGYFSFPKSSLPLLM